MCFKKTATLVGLGLWLFVQLCLPSAPCQAEIYRWQDTQGNWHFSDSPTSEAPITRPPEPEFETSAQPPSPSQAASDSSQAASGAAVATDARPGVAAHSGVLWRISVNGRDDSYLLGTIHSADARVVHLRPAVTRALDRSQRFVMEMEMDPSAIMAFGASMMFTDGRDLESVLGASLYGQVQNAMTDYGMPPALVRQFKPWAVMALLSMPKPDGGLILDLALQQRAASAGKPTAGLETAEEQLAVFEQLSMNDQIELLKSTLTQLPGLPGLMEQLIQAYAADDLNKIADLAAGYKRQGNLEALKRFTFRLNDARNLRMLQRMKPYLQQGGTFVAVGALHLAGPEGLVHLLGQAGFQIEPVP